jgi:hypothetical protein
MQESEPLQGQALHFYLPVAQVISMCIWLSLWQTWGRRLLSCSAFEVLNLSVHFSRELSIRTYKTGIFFEAPLPSFALSIYYNKKLAAGVRVA